MHVSAFVNACARHGFAVDDLLEDLTSLRRTFYVSVENVTARAQSTRGSRKVGQDSDDELSAGDLDQDDEE